MQKELGIGTAEETTPRYSNEKIKEENTITHVLINPDALWCAGLVLTGLCWSARAVSERGTSHPPVDTQGWAPSPLGDPHTGCLSLFAHRVMAHWVTPGPSIPQLTRSQ